MPVAHIYLQNEIIVSDQLVSPMAPDISEIKGQLLSMETGFDVLTPGTITDITPPCFADHVARGKLADGRFMASVAADGESAQLEMILPPRAGILKGKVSREGFAPNEKGRVSAERPYSLIGHYANRAVYLGGLMLYLPVSKVALFQRMYGSAQQ